MKRNICITMLAVMVALFLPVFVARAATVRFGMPTGTVPLGSTFAVHALLDSSQPVNAYDVTLQYSGPVVLQEIDDANSIITVWQGAPTANGSTIALQGGSLAAFEGTGGELITLYFSAKAPGTATFSFVAPSIYLADGNGTKVVPQGVSASVNITGSLAGQATSSIAIMPNIAGQATTVPQILSLAIVYDSSGQELLSFLAHDTGSGIAGTSMRYRTLLSWSAWQTVLNPAPLPSHVWEVELRATNNAGGSIEETIYDWENFAILIGWILLGIVIVIGIGMLLIKLTKKKKKIMNS